MCRLQPPDAASILPDVGMSAKTTMTVGDWSQETESAYPSNLRRSSPSGLYMSHFLYTATQKTGYDGVHPISCIAIDE